MAELPSPLSAILDEQLGPDAVSWFKDTAEPSIKKMWEIVALLKEHGIAVRLSDQRIRERLSTRTTSRSSFGSGSAYRPKPKAHVCFGVIRVGGPRIAEVRSNPINY